MNGCVQTKDNISLKKQDMWESPEVLIMNNKLITIFAVIGAVAAITGAVAYILNFKKQVGGITDCD